jgi:Flp pilus assembly protein CpaB
VIVSTQVGAGGNIRPGDFVDVILIVKTNQQQTDSQTGGGSDQYSATVVQNVKVLAVDQERTNPDPSSTTNPDEAKEENEAATTITLAVSPIQGEVLTMAEECGRVHDGRLAIALRGPGDTAKLSFRPEWPNDGPPPVCSEVLGIASLGE